MTRPKYLVVLPFMVKDWADSCISSCRLQEEGRVLTIDNTVTNRGIMRSHNLGLDERQPDEWFIIMSAAVRFGPAGGLDFIDNLVEHENHGVISCSDTYGWHLVAFRPDVVAKMGRWDENFTPYGYDDNDLSVRIHKMSPDLLWGGYPCDLEDRGMAHSIKVGGLQPQHGYRLLNYWMRKWGALPGSQFDEYWNQPFNTRTNNINFWPHFNGADWNTKAPEPL